MYSYTEYQREKLNVLCGLSEVGGYLEILTVAKFVFALHHHDDALVWTVCCMFSWTYIPIYTDLLIKNCSAFSFRGVTFWYHLLYEGLQLRE